MRRTSLILSVAFLAGIIAGCSSTSQSPDVSGNIRKSLDGAGFKDVSVSQDRDKGVVTLKGSVKGDNDKGMAESMAKAEAPGQVVADEIEVLPAGVEKEAKRMDSDMDKAIDKNLDAALVQHDLTKGVSYDTRNGVVTLSGHVPSQENRREVQQIAASVPNVQQVVNELQVKGQKASSSR
jgi:hyperosmotically inducible protein